MNNAYIFDIDGTLADCSHRLHYILPPEGAIHFNIEELDWQPDWESFYNECVNDKVIQPVADLLNIIQNSGEEIIFVTGRSDKYMEQTLEWICDKVIHKNTTILFMRKDGDHREDCVVKKEIYEEDIKPYFNVLGVFEDRTQCVKMWRSLGLTCYQVAEGDY